MVKVKSTPCFPWMSISCIIIVSMEGSIGSVYRATVEFTCNTRSFAASLLTLHWFIVFLLTFHNQEFETVTSMVTRAHTPEQLQ
jgi:hypothetical protein